jgi:hypothetical protein
VNDDYIQELMKKGRQQELTDRDIIAVVNRDDCEDDEDNGAGTGLGLGRMERMNHKEG